MYNSPIDMLYVDVDVHKKGFLTMIDLYVLGSVVDLTLGSGGVEYDDCSSGKCEAPTPPTPSSDDD